MEKKFKNLNELFGKNSEVKKSAKSLKKEEEAFFYTLIGHLCQIEAVSSILKTVGIHSDKYENSFYILLEMLLTKHYGELKTSIILWWVFDSLTQDGKVYPLVDEDGVHHLIKTPIQLYKFLKRYDGK
jgi:hypothetical protein